VGTHNRTELVLIDPDDPDPALLKRAGDYIRRGLLVAFPTETVYGLGADATSEAAVRRIFEAKERDPSDPLIVHVASPTDVDSVAIDISPLARSLIQRFWPGPLTLVLRRGPAIAPAVSAGRDTVAVRMPDHAVALGVIRAARVPVAAPSANRFTRTSATTAAHVLEDLDGRIDLVLDGGPTLHGMESTVLEATADVLRLLRPGAVTAEAIEGATGKRLAVAKASDDAPSPGMLARHYAPRTPLRFLEEGGIAALVAAAAAEVASGRTPGVLCLASEAPLFADPTVVEPLGDGLEQVAHNLYAVMRRMDARGVDVILVRDYGEAGLGRAIRDRLRRAAAKG
jgi:L-threonylcarbamoyladenylate synthase